MECFLAIRALKPWMDAYPHATDDQVAAHLRRHKYAVMALLPGGDAPNAQSMHQEFIQILKTKTYELSPS